MRDLAPLFAAVSALRPTVQVVHDRPAASPALLDLLARAGCVIVLADNTAMALSQLPRCQPDLVLLDTSTRRQSCVETCRRLKGADDLSDVPILVITGRDDTAARLACFGAGAADSLSNPLRAEEVLVKLRVQIELLQTRRALGAKGRLHRSAERQLEQGFTQAVFVVDPQGHIVFCTRSAQDMLSRHLEDFDPAVTLLPGGTNGKTFPWLSCCRKGLRARRFVEGNASAGDNSLAVLLFEEETRDPSFVLLNALKLTKREAKILYWVRQGKTSPEIAIILEVALKTVKKHLEHIFEKLGVETRTAAALLASEVLQRNGLN